MPTPRVQNRVVSGQPLLNFEQDGQSFSLGCRSSDNFVLNSDLDLVGGLDILSIDSSTGGHGLTMAATGDSSLSVNSSGKNLTISSTGGGTQQIIISSAGTGTNSVRINATAGGIDIDAVGDINIDSSTGVVKIQGNTYTPPSSATDLLKDVNDGSDSTITISSTNVGAGAAHLDINVDENITIDSSAGGISLDSVTASNFTVTGSDQSLTLNVVGGGTQQLILKSAGTGSDALRINASAGGIDIDSNGDIRLNSSSGSLYFQDVLWKTEYTYISTAVNYTILSSDEYVGVDTSSTAITITLPQISSVLKKIYHIVDITGDAATNNITVERSGSDTINGNTNIIINQNRTAITLINDKINQWFIV